MEWDNILMPRIKDSPYSATNWESEVDPVVYYYTLPCLACHRSREQRLHRKKWDHYICSECRGMMLKDGLFIIKTLHDIIYNLSEKRYPEEEFFIRIDHILKTLRLDGIILNHKFNFLLSSISVRDGRAEMDNFHIEIVLNAPTRDLRIRGIKPYYGEYGQPTLRTESFSVESCCVPEPREERAKQEYLPKEHFKWES